MPLFLNSETKYRIEFKENYVLLEKKYFLVNDENPETSPVFSASFDDLRKNTLSMGQKVTETMKLHKDTFVCAMSQILREKNREYTPSPNKINCIKFLRDGKTFRYELQKDMVLQENEQIPYFGLREAKEVICFLWELPENTPEFVKF